MIIKKGRIRRNPPLELGVDELWRPQMALERYTPRLPHEIWRFIIKLATNTPGLLDVSPLPPLSDELRSFHMGNDYSFDCSELIARRVLPRVCRLWWNLTIGLLYEYVYIQKPKLLSDVLESLQREVITSSESTVGHIGHYVKRLSITCESDPTLNDGVIDRILDSCPNITVINVRYLPRTLELPYRESPALTDRCASLRHLRVDCTYFEPDPERFMELLKSLEHLEILDLSSMHRALFPHLEAEIETTRVCLLQLHTATFRVASREQETRVMMSIGAYWDFPSLQYLSIGLASDPTGGLSIVHHADFLSKYGHHLRTLLIGWGGVYRSIDLIGRHCPNLVDCYINIDRKAKYLYMFGFPTTLELQPSLCLQRLRLAGIEHHEINLYRKAVGVFLQAGAPALRCIQLGSLPRSDFIKWEKELREWSEELEGWGVRLEDGDGSLLCRD